MVSVLLLAAAVATATPVDNGSVPTIAEAEELVKARLSDPYSAHFVWPYEFSEGPFKWPLSKAKPGYFTCGRYNAKNVYGGYIGEYWFFVQMLNGKEVLLTMDNGAKLTTPAESTCEELEQQGRLKRLAEPVHHGPR